MTAKEKNSPIAIQAFHEDLASGVHEVLTADRIWDIVLQGALLRTDLVFIEYWPVRSDARDDPYGFVAENYQLNVTASSKKWRRFGRAE